MTISWYCEFFEIFCRNIFILLISLTVCTFVCCKYHRKSKDPKFIDENDPHAQTLYNIQTIIAFPKKVSEEKQESPSTKTTVKSWSSEYECNMPTSLPLSSPTKTLHSKKNTIE